MSHYSRVLEVVIDAPPDLHDQELAFWQGALGQELAEIYSAEYYGAFLRGNDLMLLMQRLESGALASTWTFIPTIWTPKRPGSSYEFEPPPDGYDYWDDYWRAVGVSEDELGLGLDRIADPAGRGPRIWFQVVPEKKTLKNRLHVDITVSGGRANPIETRRRLVDAEAQRLEALGATLVRVICEDGVDHYAVAMRDPEGNEFDIN